MRLAAPTTGCTGDFQQCVKEYGDLIARYAADTVAHNNRASVWRRCETCAGPWTKCGEAVQILPKRVTYRANLALFADYAGDFATAEQEVRHCRADSHGDRSRWR